MVAWYHPLLIVRFGDISQQNKRFGFLYSVVKWSYCWTTAQLREGTLLYRRRWKY